MTHIFPILLAPLLIAQPAKKAATENVIRVTITPQKLPRPALRYQFVPAYRERKRGNAAHLYLKCFAEQWNFWHGKESSAERMKLMEAPLAELKKQKRLTTYGGSALWYADQGARRTICDWQLEDDLRQNGIATLLPDLQIMRSIARGLLVRSRAQIAHGDYEAAVKSLTTMFGLARHCDEHPTLIGALVGTAVSQIGLGVIDEFIAQPDAPNLYWALTSYPSPMMSYRKAWEGEREIVTYSFKDFIDGRVWGTARTREARKEMVKFTAMIGMSGQEQKIGKAFFDLATDKKWVADARKKLQKSRFAKFDVASYPPEQVAMYTTLLRFEEMFDDQMKWVLLPYHQAAPHLVTRKPKATDQATMIAFMFLPAIRSVKNTQVRIDQRLAMLRAVEAIRAHAADNNGKLPAKLSDLKLPIANDPVTNKPFGYEIKSGVAHLKNTPPKGMEKVAAYRVRYEIRLRK